MSYDAEECAEAWNAMNVALSAANGKDQQRIAEVGICVVALLLRKNLAYGSSAFEPIRIFAKGLSAMEQIRCRIDDKLSRVAKGTDFGEEDVFLDLAGYFILGLIARERETVE